MAVVMDVNVSLDRDVKERSKDRDAFARCHMMHNEKLDQLVKGYDATKKYR